MTARTLRPGVTLIELLAVIVILSTLASVATLALWHPAAPSATDPHQIIAAARREALEHGAVVDTTVTENGITRTVTLLPDGQVLADSTVAVDRLTARFADDSN